MATDLLRNVEQQVAMENESYNLQVQQMRHTRSRRMVMHEDMVDEKG
jgi:hypothetical protein